MYLSDVANAPATDAGESPATIDQGEKLATNDLSSNPDVEPQATLPKVNDGMGINGSQSGIGYVP